MSVELSEFSLYLYICRRTLFKCVVKCLRFRGKREIASLIFAFAPGFTWFASGSLIYCVLLNAIVEKNSQFAIIGERSEPHTYRTVGKNLRHIYIYVFYIYIYIYTFVRRARAVNARATRKRRTGRLRFNGQYNRLENGYFSSKL